MPTSTRSGYPRALTILLIAVAPAAWGSHLAVSYWLVPISCQEGTVAPMHLTTAVAVAVALCVAGLGWRTQSRAGADAHDRFSLPLLAFLLGSYFSGVILLTGLVALVVDPCG